jgi:hypothetical protein
MKNLIVLLVLASLGWYGYGKYQTAAIQARAERATVAGLPSERPQARLERPATRAYSCDGRTYCSQMTSCEEATWFLKNCPGTKMDGNNDGIHSLRKAVVQVTNRRTRKHS